MRMLQPSFASGEISPLLHARVDLARYGTALAGLKNMIVLPQGGVTRRPGFVRLAACVSQSGDDCPVRLIPFRYNSEDAVMIELGDRQARFWAGGRVVHAMASPYGAEHLRDLRYVQSGNIIIFAHRKVPLQMLTRKALDDWEFKTFPFEGGPWIPGSEEGHTGDSDDPAKITVYHSALGYELVSDQPGVFTQDKVGSLIRLDMEIPGSTKTLLSTPETEDPDDDDWAYSLPLECKSTYTLETFQHWRGIVVLERSINKGRSWTMIREFTKANTDIDGQVYFTGSETEPHTLYRVRARHYKDSWAPIYCKFSVGGYIKTFTFRITGLSPAGYRAPAEIVLDNPEFDIENVPEGATALEWFIGAWGRGQSYPAAAAFYQDRLVLAGTTRQPQTVWMSRVGDYKNFSVSDPLRDDDAITLTLAANDMDGIHSILALSDLLVFTPSGEWKISGSGDNGAISPKAVVAHQQSTIGCKGIQPLSVNGRAVFVQTHGTEVHALGYSLETDGYSGSEISILSRHLFEWKTQEGSAPAGREIVSMAHQQIPDGLLWFALEDGTAAVCTYNPEHEVVGWARQETAGRIGALACIPGDRHSELWAAVRRGSTWYIERLARRADETVFTDAGSPYESAMETLRVTYEGREGSAFPSKKLIARLVVSAIRSKEAWAAPAPRGAMGTDPWEKRRRIRWDWHPQLSDADIQMDSGFDRDAAIQIRTSDGPLTIVGISPVVTAGG